MNIKHIHPHTVNGQPITAITPAEAPNDTERSRYIFAFALYFEPLLL